MHSPLRPRLNAIPLVLAAGALAVATGCGSSGSPAVPVGPMAAKHIYTLQPSGSNAGEADSVLVFSATATGTTVPTSTLSLPVGFAAVCLASGPSGELYIGGSVYQGAAEVLEYAAGATGSATPTITLAGGQNTFNFPLLLAVSPQGQLSVADDLGYVYTFPLGLTSDTLPSNNISYVVDHQGFILGLGADGSGNIYVSDVANSVIDIFASTASGSTAPVRTITGTASNSFDMLLAIAVDSDGNIAVDNYNESDDPYDEVSAASSRRFLRTKLGARPLDAVRRPHPHSDLPVASTSIFVFAAGASGNAAPSRSLSGASTTINEPDGIALDALSNLYYFDFAGGTPVIMTFPASATGNVAPTTSFTTSAAVIDAYDDIAVY